ncbi:MAG TPA: class I SAM-dependent methyltransferase [Candidatus Saccharimonadales bacterium]|nr:class I SAM-dependent methyltransferase [Candidatus Saccharimonadales bacterium]
MRGLKQNWDHLYNQNHDFRQITSQALTTVLSHVNQNLEKTCLDLGCGTGQLTRELFHRGYDCIGVDGAESAIHIARSLTTQTVHLTYLQGNLETLEPNDLPKQQFSLITCKLVFAFIKDKERFLKLAHEFLSPDGTFVIITPVFGSKTSEIKPSICVDRDETDRLLHEQFGHVTVMPLDNSECFIAYR